MHDGGKNEVPMVFLREIPVTYYASGREIHKLQLKNHFSPCLAPQVLTETCPRCQALDGIRVLSFWKQREAQTPNLAASLRGDAAEKSALLCCFARERAQQTLFTYRIYNGYWIFFIQYVQGNISITL